MFIFILSFWLTIKIYPSKFLLFYTSTDVPVHHYTCLVCFFFYGVSCTMMAYPAQWPFNSSTRVPANLPLYLQASLLSNHKDIPVTTTTCVHVHTCTCSWHYLFMFILLFWLTSETYPSMFLLLYMYTDIMHLSYNLWSPVIYLINRRDLPINVSTALHVHWCTCSSAYLFSLFLPFWHNMQIYLSTHLQGYVQTDQPKNKSTCFIFLLCLRTKTYLSPQLLVYLLLKVPVHDPTCLF